MIHEKYNQQSRKRMEVIMEFPHDRRLRIIAEREERTRIEREAIEQALSGLPPATPADPTPTAPDVPIRAETITGMP